MTEMEMVFFSKNFVTMFRVCLLGKLGVLTVINRALSHGLSVYLKMNMVCYV